MTGRIARLVGAPETKFDQAGFDLLTLLFSHFLASSLPRASFVGHHIARVPFFLAGASGLINSGSPGAQKHRARPDQLTLASSRELFYSFARRGVVKATNSFHSKTDNPRYAACNRFIE